MIATPAEKFPIPIREPKRGTFHRPAHGFGLKPAPEAVGMTLSGPLTGEQKLGEERRDLPSSENQTSPAERARRDETGARSRGALSEVD